MCVCVCICAYEFAKVSYKTLSQHDRLHEFYVQEHIALTDLTSCFL